MLGEVIKSNNGCLVEVVHYVNTNEVWVQFQDSYGYVKVTTKRNLIKGAIENPYRKSVCGLGFVGVLPSGIKKDREYRKAYIIWYNMMRRCYEPEKSSRSDSYGGCVVHPDWHNFQNYYLWLKQNNFYGLGYHVDKDILVRGNKVYSPKTCRLVPQEINKLFCDSGASRGEYPIGVSYLKRLRKYRARLVVDNKEVHLGCFDTVEDAYIVYSKAKELHIKNVAERWKGAICDDIYQALLSWRADTLN